MGFKKVSPPSLPSGSITVMAPGESTPTTTQPSATPSDAGQIATRDSRPVWERPVAANIARLGELLAQSPACLRGGQDKLYDPRLIWIFGVGPVTDVLVVREDARLEDIQTLVRIVDRANETMPYDKVLRMVSELYYLTTTRKESDADVALRFSAYAGKLAELPGDAVRAALQQWPMENKFFPSWQELYDLITRYAGQRLLIRKRLARILQDSSEKTCSAANVQLTSDGRSTE